MRVVAAVGVGLLLVVASFGANLERTSVDNEPEELPNWRDRDFYVRYFDTYKKLMAESGQCSPQDRSTFAKIPEMVLSSFAAQIHEVLQPIKEFLKHGEAREYLVKEELRREFHALPQWDDAEFRGNVCGSTNLAFCLSSHGSASEHFLAEPSFQMLLDLKYLGAHKPEAPWDAIGHPCTKQLAKTIAQASVHYFWQHTRKGSNALLSCLSSAPVGGQHCAASVHHLLAQLQQKSSRSSTKSIKKTSNKIQLQQSTNSQKKKASWSQQKKHNVKRNKEQGTPSTNTKKSKRERKQEKRQKRKEAKRARREEKQKGKQGDRRKNKKKGKRRKYDNQRNRSQGQDNSGRQGKKKKGKRRKNKNQGNRGQGQDNSGRQGKKKKGKRKKSKKKKGKRKKGKTEESLDGKKGMKRKAKAWKNFPGYFKKAFIEFKGFRRKAEWNSKLLFSHCPESDYAKLRETFLQAKAFSNNAKQKAPNIATWKRHDFRKFMTFLKVRVGFEDLKKPPPAKCVKSPFECVTSTACTYSTFLGCNKMRGKRWSGAGREKKFLQALSYLAYDWFSPNGNPVWKKTSRICRLTAFRLLLARRFMRMMVYAIGSGAKFNTACFKRPWIFPSTCKRYVKSYESEWQRIQASYRLGNMWRGTYASNKKDRRNIKAYKKLVKRAGRQSRAARGFNGDAARAMSGPRRFVQNRCKKWRLMSPVDGYVASIFGPRALPSGAHDFHTGVDLAPKEHRSAPVFAAADGVVLQTAAGCANVGYKHKFCGRSKGNFVWIKHNADAKPVTSTLYAHLHAPTMGKKGKEPHYGVFVVPGQKVKMGQVIGMTGITGDVLGVPVPHLHFQAFVRPKNSKSEQLINPCQRGFMKCGRRARKNFVATGVQRRKRSNGSPMTVAMMGATCFLATFQKARDILTFAAHSMCRFSEATVRRNRAFGRFMQKWNKLLRDLAAAERKVNPSSTPYNNIAQCGNHVYNGTTPFPCLQTETFPKLFSLGMAKTVLLRSLGQPQKWKRGVKTSVWHAYFCNSAFRLVDPGGGKFMMFVESAGAVQRQMPALPASGDVLLQAGEDANVKALPDHELKQRANVAATIEANGLLNSLAASLVHRAASSVAQRATSAPEDRAALWDVAATPPPPSLLSERTRVHTRARTRSRTQAPLDPGLMDAVLPGSAPVDDWNTHMDVDEDHAPAVVSEAHRLETHRNFCEACTKLVAMSVDLVKYYKINKMSIGNSVEYVCASLAEQMSRVDTNEIDCYTFVQEADKLGSTKSSRGLCHKAGFKGC